jgi:L-lactate dehydrogenase (cytochrome)
LKALALGAQFVFIGRPFLCAAAVAGEPGVRHAFKLLQDEIDRDMALLGIKTLAEMRREFLTTARGSGFLEKSSAPA